MNLLISNSWKNSRNSLIAACFVFGFNSNIVSAQAVSTAIPFPKNSAPWIGESLAGSPCRGNRQAYGPYDFTKPDHRRESLQLVESAHFDERVKRLIEDKSDATLISDLDYTIRAYPNHHNALYALITYWFLPDSSKRVSNKRMVTPPECYFQRGINFKQDDGTVKMLYGLYLHRMKKSSKAQELYKEAEILMPESAQLFYNMGLLYFDMQQYENAISYANKAYGKHYPLPGLMNKLKKKGLWK